MPRARERRRPSRASVSCGWSFPNQLADAVLVFVLIARPIAAMNVTDLALAIDDDGARHLIDVIRLAHLVGGVEQNWKADRLAGQQFFDGRRFLVDIDSDQGKAGRLVLLVHLVEQR